jgi:hypothetical protein
MPDGATEKIDVTLSLVLQHRIRSHSESRESQQTWRKPQPSTGATISLTMPYCHRANPPITWAYAFGHFPPVPDLPSRRRPIHRRGARQNGSGSLPHTQGRNGCCGICESGARHRYRAAEHDRPPRFPGAATVPFNGWPYRAVSGVRCGSCRTAELRRDSTHLRTCNGSR